MPLDVIKEKPEYRMREEDLDEIDEMWRKYYDVDCRRNRHRKKMFPKVDMKKWYPKPVYSIGEALDMDVP